MACLDLRLWVAGRALRKVCAQESAVVTAGDEGMAERGFVGALLGSAEVVVDVDGSPTELGACCSSSAACWASSRLSSIAGSAG